VERLPFPIDWSKGKEDSYYWHSVYDVVLKHYENQLNNQLNQSINQTQTQKSQSLKEVPS